MKTEIELLIYLFPLRLIEPFSSSAWNRNLALEERFFCVDCVFQVVAMYLNLTYILPNDGEIKMSV